MNQLPDFPTDHFGEILAVETVNEGLSGAAVYFVKTGMGDFVLRTYKSGVAKRQALIQQLAADNWIAPPLLYADESGQTMVSARIMGPPFTSVLSDTGKGQAAIISLIDTLSNLHAVASEDVHVVDPLSVARRMFDEQSSRRGFPTWALPFADFFPEFERTLACDDRRVLSHNDLNPGNILWDGTRVWLVDWEESGLTHPYYDLACISTFLYLPMATGLALLSRQEKNAISADQVKVFGCLRQIASILYGCIFLNLVSDLEAVPATGIEETARLSECYGRLASGDLVLQDPRGQSLLGRALLAGVEFR